MSSLKWAMRILASAAMLTVTASAAHAQLAWTVYGVGEYDTSEVIFVLGGVSVAPARAGWVPVAGVSASWLQFPTGAIIGDDKREVTTITPTLGVANNFGTGTFQLRAGYAFASGDDDDAVPIVAGDVGEDGFVGIAQVDYWGTGALGAQAIASYNFGAEALWARGRVTHRIARIGDDGNVRLGAELAYLDSDDYSATQVGGVLGFQPGRSTILTAGVGRKLAEAGEDATYFRLEVVLLPR